MTEQEKKAEANRKRAESCRRALIKPVKDWLDSRRDSIESEIAALEKEQHDRERNGDTK